MIVNDSEEFRKAALAYGEKTTSSPEAARAALVQLGTHDKKGNLTPLYASYKNIDLQYALEHMHKVLKNYEYDEETLDKFFEFVERFKDD